MDGPHWPPMVCTLTEPELRERRAGLLRRVRERVLAVRRVEGAAAPAAGAAPAKEGKAAPEDVGPAAPGAGVELRFAGDEAIVADVLELVRLESRCCAFLRFRVTLEPGGGPLLLEITGPPGGAELLTGDLTPEP
jgi:hypothetical protein